MPETHTTPTQRDASNLGNLPLPLPVPRTRSCSGSVGLRLSVRCLSVKPCSGGAR